MLKTPYTLAALLSLSCACELPGSGEDDTESPLGSTLPVVTIALDCDQPGPADGVVLHPTDPARLAVYQPLAITVADPARTLMISDDGGRTLKKLPVDHLGAPAFVADGLVARTARGGYVYASFDGQVHPLTFSPDPDQGAPLGAAIAQGPGDLTLALTQQRQVLWRERGQWTSLPDQFLRDATDPDSRYSARGQRVWALDAQNTLAVSTDGGYRFSPRAKDVFIRDLLVSDGVAWVNANPPRSGADEPVLYRSNDDGQTLSPTPFVGITTLWSAPDAQTLYFAASPRAWHDGGRGVLDFMMLRTTDGGQTFSQLHFTVAGKRYTDPNRVALAAHADGQLTVRLLADEDDPTSRTLLCRTSSAQEGALASLTPPSLPSRPGQLTRVARYRTQVAPGLSFAVGPDGQLPVGVGSDATLDLGAKRGLLPVAGPWSRLLDVWPLPPDRIVAIGQPQGHTLGKQYDPERDGDYEAVLIDAGSGQVLSRQPLAVRRALNTDRFVSAPLSQWTRLKDGRFAAVADKTLFTFSIDDQGRVTPDAERPLDANIGLQVTLSPDGTQHATLYPNPNTSDKPDTIRVNDAVCDDASTSCFDGDARLVDMAIDDDGTVYAIDGTQGRVLARAPGEPDWRVLVTGLLHPTHIQLDPVKGAGLIYILDGDLYAFIPSDTPVEATR